MKVILSFLLVIFISNLTIAQPIEWQKSFGGTLDDRAESIQQTADGGYIVAGRSDSYNGNVVGNHGNGDYWVVKITSVGNITWRKCLGGSGTEYAYSIQQTLDGGYIVAGISSSTDGDVIGNHGGADCWVVKLDSIGNIIWQNSLGGTNWDQAYSIQQTLDEGYIVAGYSKSTDGDVSGNHGVDDSWVVKLDSSGSLTWQKCLGGTNADRAFSIQQTSDGGYIVAGYSISTDGDVIGNHGSYDNWVVKLNSIGAIDWQKCLGGTSWDQANSIIQTAEGGYIVAGFTNSTDGDVTGNHGSEDYWVVKLDSMGSITWQKSIGGSSGDAANSIKQTADGGYIVAGYSPSTDGDVTGNHGGWDYWVVKLDDIGNIMWQKSLGGSTNDVATSIQLTSDGRYIVAGRSDSNDGDVTGNHGSWDYWVVKLSATVGVIEMTQLTTEFNVFPNPTTGKITIDLGEVKQDIQAKLTNSLGQVILTQNYTSTAYINLNLDYPKGLYFLTLETEGEVITKKIVVE